MREAVIVSGCRTAIGRARRGSLKDTRPEELGGIVIKEAVKRAGIDVQLVEDVIIGCAHPEGAQGGIIARNVVFAAGWPDTIPAVTVNRYCASGLEAINMGATRVIAGYSDVVVCGGVESMTYVPMGGYNWLPLPRLIDEWPECYTPMGITSENVVKKYGITFEEQNKYAYESQMKAKVALEKGVFKDQIVPVETFVESVGPDGKVKKKKIVFDVDECVRPDTTLEGMATVKPAFALKGTVTAANSSPLNDGAAAVVIMSKEKAKESGCKIMATFKFCVSVGVPPEIMGVGPLYAINKLFQKTGLTKDNIDLYEINEAFASQAHYCTKELGLDMSKVNVNGGAIALGHPLGCTGAKLTVQLLYEMEKRNAKRGIVSMCIGGGMGSAGLFERE